MNVASLRHVLRTGPASVAALLVTLLVGVAGAQSVGFVGSDPETLIRPGPITPDGSGNVYVAGIESHNLIRVEPDGTITVLAAVGMDLPAPFARPEAVALDSSGNVYVACRTSDNVFRFTPSGDASVVLDANGDGLGHDLDAPDSLAIDANDNVWVSSRVGETVFMISPGGAVSFVMDGAGLGPGMPLVQPVVNGSRGRVFALGTGEVFELDASGPPVELIGPSGDGVGNTLDFPRQAEVDPLGSVYVRDFDDVFRVSPVGTVGAIFSFASEMAVDGTDSVWFKGTFGPPGALAELELNGNLITYPFPVGTVNQGLRADEAGNAWYLQRQSGGFTPTTVLTIPDGGQPTVVFSSPGPGGTELHKGVAPVLAADGAVWVKGFTSRNIVRIVPSVSDDEVVGPPDWDMDDMRDVHVDRWGRVVAVGFVSGTVVRFDPGTGTVEQLPDASGDGLGNTIGLPRSVVTNSQGAVWVASSFNDRVFRIDSAGQVTLVMDGSGDGVHPLDGPHGLTVDSLDNVYVTGNISDNVFRITPDGVVSQIVDLSGDGAGNFLLRPEAIAVGPDGAVYVAGFASDNVLRISTDGTVTAVDMVTGTGEDLLQPSGVAVGRDGTLFVASSGNDLVFVRTPAGVISIAVILTRDGPSSLAPADMLVDAFGSLYVVDQWGDAVLRRDPDGTITTLMADAGTAETPGFESPRAIGLSPSGDVVVPLWESAYPIALTQDDWFTDLGGSSPGVAGHPELRARSALAAGSPTDLVLKNAPPGALVLTWLSFAPTPFDALGGTVHAFPANVQRLFVADGAGQFALSLPWPANLPSGLDIHLQFIVQDGTVPDGLTLSNGVKATTP